MSPPTTLRDLLLDAEQARAQVAIGLCGEVVEGRISDVGVDYVTISASERFVDVALFHIRTVARRPGTSPG